MRKVYKPYSIVLILSLLGSLAFSQNPTGEIEAAEFIIEKEANLTLPPAARSFNNFSFDQGSTFIPQIDFSIQEPQIQIPPFRPDIKFSNLERPSILSRYSHRLTVGFGNMISPLVDYEFQSLNDDNEFIGAKLFHESYQEGPVRQDASANSISSIGLYGALVGKRASLNPSATYRHRSYYFYGLSDSAYSSNSTEIIADKIFDHNINVNAHIKGSGARDRLNFEVRPAWSILMQGSDGNNFNSENNLSIMGKISGEVKGINPEIGVIAYTSSYESGQSLDRTWISASPGFWIYRDNLSIRTGLVLGSYTDPSGESDIFFYPDMRVNYGMSDRMSLFSIIGGEVRKNTLEELVTTNSYLEDSLDLRSTFTNLNLTLGINGSLIPDLSYEISTSFSSIEDQLLLINSFPDSSRFSARYDNVKQSSLKVTLAYDYLDLVRLHAKAQFLNYNLDSLTTAYHLPTIRLEIDSEFLIKRKLIFGTNFSVLNGISTELSDGTKQSMNTIFDLGSSLTYLISEQASIFIRAGNILNQNNERYLYYPVNSTTFKMGFTYLF